MIDTNIIEKEYDIKDSQCNFGGLAGGEGEMVEGKSEGVDWSTRGRGVVGGPRIYLSR